MSTTKYQSAHERLKVLRKRLGKTQAEMAGLLHLSTTGYQNYERGEREIPVVTLERARDHIGLNPDWVLDGSGEMFLAGPGPERDRIMRTAGVAGGVPPAFDAGLMRTIIAATARLSKRLTPEKLAEVCALAYELERSAASRDPEARVSQLLKLAG